MSEINVKDMADPTLNVRELFDAGVKRIDNLREAEIKRIDEKIKDGDVKYQIQFTAAKEAVSIASTAQEKLVAQALDGTKEAINKAAEATDKRFELLSEKIDGVSKILSQNQGAQGIYVTRTDLAEVMDKLQTSFEDALKPVVAFMNSQQGSKTGISDLAGWIFGGVTLLATIFGVMSGHIK